MRCSNDSWHRRWVESSRAEPRRVRTHRRVIFCVEQEDCHDVRSVCHDRAPLPCDIVRLINHEIRVALRLVTVQKRVPVKHTMSQMHCVRAADRLLVAEAVRVRVTVRGDDETPCEVDSPIESRRSLRCESSVCDIHRSSDEDAVAKPEGVRDRRSTSRRALRLRHRGAHETAHNCEQVDFHHSSDAEGTRKRSANVPQWKRTARGIGRAVPYRSTRL